MNPADNFEGLHENIENSNKRGRGGDDYGIPKAWGWLKYGSHQWYGMDIYWNCPILNEVFVISRIIKSQYKEVCISRAEGQGWYHLPSPWLFWISKKTESYSCFITHCFEENTCSLTNTPLHRKSLTLLLEIVHCVSATCRLVTNLLADNWLICRLH